MGTGLEQLKQAYLSLSEADRAAFSDWHASIIRDQLSTSASANSAVLLSGGTGKRARLNGVCATLVAGSRRCGWVDVIAQGERVPWRQGGVTLERLECPSLRELRCSDLGGYGNGLVPRDPTGSGSWWWWRERPGPGVCDQPCKFTQSSFSVGSQQPDCPLIDLPEQCIVYWSGRGRHSRELRATSTTTYGELYDLMYTTTA
jgi:hypothetical protein